MKSCRQPWFVFLALLLGCGCCSSAQSDVTAKVLYPASTSRPGAAKQHAALFWLDPLNAVAQQHLVWRTHEPYRLVQKNKMFSPHLLVIPVGATVSFPNADPFFHNVFSLFNGKRFDLGLYEAGTSREVHFAQSGISYIFCNIHPEMGAVVVSLRTPLWSAGGPDHVFSISRVPEGDYEARLWIEGEDERRLAKWTHIVHVREHGTVNAGSFEAAGADTNREHLNKFGQPYQHDPPPY